MQITDKQKRIILVVLGIIIVLLILLFVLKGCGAKEFAITFDTNGGSNVSSLTIKKEGKITKPEDPTKEGYVFDGWYYNGKEFDFNTEITKDMKLEARWAKVEVTGINLNAQNLTLKPEGIAELEVIFTPEGASSELVWESSDPSIVTVSENGELKALKDGEATITVTTKDGKYSATCKIKVEDDAVAVTSVSIKGSKEVTVGSTIKLTANIKPTDASNKEVIWKSSDSKIATVDSKGNVKGLKAGKVKITVTTVDGEKEATIEITVKEKSATTTPSNPSTPSTGGSSTPSTGGSSGGTSSVVKVISVTINEGESISIQEGGTRSLHYTINPSNATNKEVTWSTDRNDIVTVDQKGNIKAQKAGTAKITVTTKDGSKTDTITIIVTPKPVNYTVTLSALKRADGGVAQYRIVSVLRNGSTFGDYKYLTPDQGRGRRIQVGTTNINSSLVNDGALKEMYIVLNDDSLVKATIVYGPDINVDEEG